MTTIDDYDVIYLSSTAFPKGRDVVFRDIIRVSMERNKQLLVSPLCLPLAQRRDVLAQVEVDTDRLVISNQPLRFLPTLKRMKELLMLSSSSSTPTCGAPVHMEIRLQSGWKWQAEALYGEECGTYLAQHMTHTMEQFLDLISWLLDGAEVTTVTSRFQRLIPFRRFPHVTADQEAGGNDYGTVHFETATGVAGTIQVSFVSRKL